MGTNKPEFLDVLEDFLKERGKSWLAEVAEHREFLFQCVLSAAANFHSPNEGVRRHCGCSDRSSPRPHEIDRHHDPACVYGRFLRVLGGPEVATRQMNASHEQALMATPEEMRLKQLGTTLLELSAEDDWVSVSRLDSGLLRELQLRSLVQIRTSSDGEVVQAQSIAAAPASIHDTMDLVRKARAHERCWDCDHYNHRDDDPPGHCRNCEQEWPPEGPCSRD